MRIASRMIAIFALFASLIFVVGDTDAQRFGGGGRGGGGGHGGGQPGGGGARGGGGGGGHAGGPMARPAPAKAPSQQPAMHSGAAHGPGGNLSGATLKSPQSRPGAGGAGERNAWEGPRGGTLVAGGGQKSFAGPGGGSATGGSAHYAYKGPQGGVTVGGGKGGSVTGPGGKTVAGGQAGHVTIGPQGNIHAGDTKGLAVKGPGGGAIAGSHGTLTAGPGGAFAKSTKGAAGVGPGGAFAAGSKSAAGVGPGGAFATQTKGGAIVGPGGAAAAAHRGSVAVGPYGAAAREGTLVAGRGYGGAAAVGTRYVNAQSLSNQANFVRNNFVSNVNNYNAFTPNWYNRYPGAWVGAGLAAGALWRGANWGSSAGYVGYPADASPIYYNYGDNVTYQDGNVYYDDQLLATSAEYAQQAMQIVDTGRQAHPPEDEKSEPLGVFAMTRGDETSSNDIFQLAVNKDGVMLGNYYNAVNDSTMPVYGSLDKKTQRLAWAIGDKKTPVFETGLYNLTLDQSPLLAHYGPDRTEQHSLFRLEQPTDEKTGSDG